MHTNSVENELRRDLEGTSAALARIRKDRDDLLALLQSMAATISMGNEPKHWDTEKTQDMFERAIAKALGQ